MASKAIIEERRRRVWAFQLKGVPETMIANALSVHRNTIVNDIRELRKIHREQVAEADVMTEIGDAASKFEFIFKEALSEYAQAEKPGAKSLFLERATAALAKKVQLLVECGVLPKAAQEISGKLVIEGVDVNKASLEELEGLRSRLVAQLNN